jgi:RNA polymerase sigma-70 factor (ECF subfamily)
MEQEAFLALLQKVRHGDAEAAAEVVRHFEPAIRRALRLRLTDPRLRRVLDSSDVCQSVLANFFVRAASGQFDLRRPEQLLNLLLTMAHNRLLNHIEHERAARRDHRRLQPEADALAAVADQAASPSEIVAGRDLLEEVRRRLFPRLRRRPSTGRDGRRTPYTLKTRSALRGDPTCAPAPGRSSRLFRPGK